jgi:hypothetical protein
MRNAKFYVLTKCLRKTCGTDLLVSQLTFFLHSLICICEDHPGNAVCDNS